VADTWITSQRRTLLDVLDRRLETDADSLYLDVCGTRWTAAQLDAASDGVAAGLAELGVGAGDRVGMLLENAPELVLAWWATVKLGAVAVPVNTAHKGVYLGHQLGDADPKVLVLQGDLADRLPPVIAALDALEHVVTVGDTLPPLTPHGWHRWADLAAATGRRPPVSVRPADLATLIYTGGTTGPSKGCMLSQNYHVHMSDQNVRTWRRGADDVVWTPLPLFHFNALQVALVGTLLAGSHAVIARRFSVSGFWQAINDAGATIASLLGSLAVMIARDVDRPEQPRSGDERSNTTLRLVTGAPMPSEIDTAYRERFGIATFSEAYGTTEACLLSWLPDGVPSRAGSAGVVNDEYFDVRIFDDDDNELPPGTEGEIVCRPRMADVMFDGYWRRPEATVRCSANWWLHTGDIGRIDDDGYLFFVDRKADYIRRRGENISGWELEQTFHQHEAVADVAVHAVPSAVSEDEVKVTVVLQPGAALTEEELCRWSVDRLPYFAVPRYIEFVAELPKNSTGRITKAPLREAGVTPATWDRELAGVSFDRR